MHTLLSCLSGFQNEILTIRFPKTVFAIFYFCDFFSAKAWQTHEIVVSLYGVPFLGMTETSFDDFVNHTVKELEKRNHEKFVKEWKKLTAKGDIKKIIAEKKLQFPYFLNRYGRIKELARSN